MNTRILSSFVLGGWLVWALPLMAQTSFEGASPSVASPVSHALLLSNGHLHNLGDAGITGSQTPSAVSVVSVSSKNPTPLSSYGAPAPHYVPAMSGEIPMFEPSVAVRRGPGMTTGGDGPVNPDILDPTPLSDAPLLLLLLAVGYAFFGVFKRRERKTQKKIIL